MKFCVLESEINQNRSRKFSRTGAGNYHLMEPEDAGPGNVQNQQLVFTNARQLAGRAAQAVLVVQRAGRIETHLEQSLTSR